VSVRPGLTFRPAPLKAAAALAVGFVAVRVVYRVLFHGADGTGVVVLPLPEVRLPAPFAHVVMLGPATNDGLWDAAASALPIAVLILVFGVLNALVDVARLLARASHRGPLRGVTRTLAVAWATLPALVDAARAVRTAQRLRSEPGGLRGGARLLAPLLQRTLERVGAVAAALELRGLAGRAVEGDCARPVFVRDAELRHPGSAAVRIDELTLAPGTLTVLAGPTGSGKTTVLRALSGLHTHLDGGRTTGVVDVAGHDRAGTPPRDLSRLVGVVLQDPREGFTSERVADEIGLALALRGVAPSIVAARVADVAARAGIPELLTREVRGLSAGEATLVAIAAAVVEQPVLLLVDEPLADLDVAARARIVALLDALAHEAGICVLVAEHRVAEFTGLRPTGDASVADRVLVIREGAVVEGAVRGDGALEGAMTDRAAMVHPEPSAGDPVLRVHELTVRHRGRTAVDQASLELRAGEIVALVGPNGAGKSSLLTAIALPQPTGRTAVDTRGRAVALVPDASDDLFLRESVEAECRAADRRAGRPVGTTSARFTGFLGEDADSVRSARLRLRHPRDLSAGERRLLALALQLARDPGVLLIDEPTRGLDPDACRLVADALTWLAARGTAVLVATHDAGFAAAVADRVLPLEGGRLGAALSPARAHGAPSSGGSDAEHPQHQAAASAASPTRAVFDSAGEPAGEGDTGAARRSDTRRAGSPEGRPQERRRARVTLATVNVVALAAFCWPLVAAALPAQSQAAAPVIALALAPLAALVVLSLLDGTVRSAHSLALLGTLAAIGAAIRIAGTGVGGVEAVFILLILAGRAFGPRFGLLLGMLTIALSSLVSGGIGPWTPFQMFACAWVGAGAGLLPRMRGVAEVVLLCAYGVTASYAFGLVMNLWFWPFAVGAGAGISYEAGAPLGQNLASFFVYSLVTSTLTWDTLRAITTVIGILVVGRAILGALRRAKPVAPAAPISAPAHAPALR
jgi:energy-coupling factor transporter ATP-binding protein EcfA2